MKEKGSLRFLKRGEPFKIPIKYNIITEIWKETLFQKMDVV